MSTALSLTRPTLGSDIRYIAEHIRPEDRDEVGALGFTPIQALGLSVDASTLCMTLVCPNTGLPGALLGVAPTAYEWMGGVWLLGTTLIEDNAICFLRQSKITLPLLFDHMGVPALGNYVYARNTLHLRWLRWLGFKFIRKVQLGPQNEEFIEFIKLKE